MPNISPQQKVMSSHIEIGISKIPNIRDFTYESFDFYSRVILDPLYVEIDHSLEMMFKTAQVVLADRNSIREMYPITGNEVVTIRYKNSFDTSEIPEKIIHFRIFNFKESPNLNEDGAMVSNYLTLNLVEFPAFDFMIKNKVYLTFPWGGEEGDRNDLGNLSVSQMIESMLENVPNLLNWYDLEIDETLENDEELFNFFIPNWTPMKTIKYLSRFAADKDNENFRFFTFTTTHSTGEGIRPKLIFRSVYRYLDTKDRRVYSNVHSMNMGRKPIGADDEASEQLDDIPEDDYSPADYIRAKKLVFSDGSQLAFSRLSGKTVASFDYIEDNHYQAFDFENFLENYSSQLSLNSSHSKKYGNQWSDFCSTPFTNKSQIKNLYLNNYNKLIMNSVKCHIHTHLNQLRYPGEVAYLYLPSENTDNGHLDMMFQGNWLTWSVKDIIRNDGSSLSEVRFLKDGFFIMSNDTDELYEYDFIGETEI